MTTTIFAEDLKQYDKIIIPASIMTCKRELRVISNPVLDKLTVNGFAYPIKNGITIGKQTPIQFGRKVSLDIERPDK